MNQLLSRINIKKFDLLLMLAIIIYPLLFVWAGVDLSDTGYSISMYKQIFRSPEMISNSSSIILTSILGGLWLKIFPFMEYISCKLGYALIIILINFFMFKIFTDIFKNKTLLLFSLLLSTICITHLDWFFLNYSSLTVLFFISGSYFLHKGIINKSKSYIFISSILFSLNVFIRFANVLGVFFFLTPFIWNLFNIQQDKDKINQELKNSLKFSIIFLTGYFLTIVCFLLCLKFSGCLSLYFDGFKYLNVSSSDNHHSIPFLLNLYIATYLKSILISLNFIGLFFIFFKLKEIKKTKNISLILMLPIILLFLSVNTLIVRPNLINKISVFDFPAVSILLMFQEYESYWFHLGYILFLGIFLFIPCFLLFDKKADPKLRFLSFRGILVALFSLAGSNWSFLNGYWFLILISIYYIFNLENFKNSSLKRDSKLKKIGLCLIVFLTAFSIITSEACLNDYSSIMDLGKIIKNHAFINDSRFAGIITTRERAETLNNFIKIYPNYIKPTDSLIAWPHLPLLYYITESKPALGVTWPSVLHYKIFNAKLQELAHNKNYPVILISKYQDNCKVWPKRLILPPYENITDSSIYAYSNPFLRDLCEQNKTIKNFIKQNNYNKVWENNAFVIYKSYAKVNMMNFTLLKKRINL